MPLAHKEKTASAQLTENGRSKKNICKVSSRLIVRRDRTTGKAVIVVGTYLHQRDFDMQRLDTVATDFTGTGFTGYFITSRTDGTMLAGKRIVNGKEQFRFYLNPLPPEQRPEEDGEEVEETHLFLDITPAAIGTRALSVRGKESGETLFCSICHRPGEDCYCIVIKPNCKICGQKQDVCLCDKCEECGELRVGGNCLCCAFCHKYPCTCHGSSNNNPKPGDTDTGNTGEGGNSGGYGGGSSSSVGTGGSSGGGGGSSTGSAKSSPATLTTTANKTVSTMKSKYGSSQAVCNFGVQTAFKSIYGSSNLPPGMKGRANEMAKAWADNPKYWQPISLSEAQSYANQGYFVVAGYINPVPGRSGHVVVVVPGQEKKSDSWGCNVPNVMDTGSNKRTDKQWLSQSFRSSQKNNIHFYYYKKP